MSDRPEPYLTVVDLASILKVKVKTVQNLLSSDPAALPPRSRLPCVTEPRWSPRIVTEWQAKFDPTSAEPSGKRRVGRPTKREQIARRLASV